MVLKIRIDVLNVTEPIIQLDVHENKIGVLHDENILDFESFEYFDIIPSYNELVSTISFNYKENDYYEASFMSKIVGLSDFIEKLSSIKSIELYLNNNTEIKIKFLQEYID